MVSDITLGRYYASKSPVHSLDPRVKLAAALIFIVLLFVIRSSLTYLFCLLVLLVLYRVSCVPFSYLLRGLRGILLLLFFTFILRAFFSEGEALWSFWVFKLTWNGLYKAIRLTSRISLMIMGASLLSYTTTPKQMADGIEHALGFLKRFRVPVNDIALITTIAFRFIPILNEEVGILMDAQASRGVDFSKGGPIAKMGRIFSLVIPLFISAVRRSADLAMAMEARGYSGNNVCTKMYPLSYAKSDIKAWVLVLIYIPAVLIVDISLIMLL